jgi:ATP-dependent DNA helicase RecG
MQIMAEPVQLTTSIDAVPGVGPKRAPLFRKLGIRAAAHLLRHLPLRYEYEEEESDIAGLKPGELVSARGEIETTRFVARGRPRFEAMLADDDAALHLVWFNSRYLVDRIKPGMRLRVQGKVQSYHEAIQMVNPRWERLPDDADPARRAEAMRPIYPTTEDLPSGVIANVIAQHLDDLLEHLDDHLTAEYRHDRELPELAVAYRRLHAPDISQGRLFAEQCIDDARRRLAFDELLMLQLAVQLKRYHLRTTQSAPPLHFSDEIDGQICRRFPFELTEHQRRAVDEIIADVQRDSPMNRMLQGDVGSGKTAVALYAMLLAFTSGHQSALMAPTELLAEQHFASISRMLTDTRVRVGLITGGMPAAERRELVEACATGDLHIIVGTHALLTDDVRFRSLALAVTDEQHRFGVEQRAQLREKAFAESDEDATRQRVPHVLVMTATPIPRTLSLTIFGDLDVSTIKGLPPGRSPIKTRLADPTKTDEVYAYARGRMEQGDQVYVVLPAIEDSISSGLRAVESTHRLLTETHFAGLQVAAVHGRIPRDEREQIMDRFRAGEIDCLVATTVIEVGVDVPNATLMIIEHAERFGLAQLHQLRGRIGRGSKQSLCVLIGDPTTEDAKLRLDAIVRTTDGFDIAEEDLLIRGMGEIVGTRQAGAPDFHVARLPDDLALLRLAARDAEQWIARSPTLDLPEEALLRRRLIKAHGEWIGLADVG